MDIVKDQGGLAEAEECYKRCIPGYQKLIDRYPATVTYAYDLAMMKNNLGLTLTYLRPADAEATFQGAIAIWQRYAKELPNDPAEFPKWLAYSTTNLAFHLSNCPDATLRNPQRGVELAKQATQILPDDALTWNNLGTAHYRNNEFAAAATALASGMVPGSAFSYPFGIINIMNRIVMSPLVYADRSLTVTAR